MLSGRLRRRFLVEWRTWRVEDVEVSSERDRTGEAGTVEGGMAGGSDETAGSGSGSGGGGGGGGRSGDGSDNCNGSNVVCGSVCLDGSAGLV